MNKNGFIRHICMLSARSQYGVKMCLWEFILSITSHERPNAWSICSTLILIVLEFETWQVCIQSSHGNILGFWNNLAHYSLLCSSVGELLRYRDEEYRSLLSPCDSLISYNCSTRSSRVVVYICNFSFVVNFHSWYS